MDDTGAVTERVLVCRSDGERFALPAAMVREVVALPPLSRIPGATSRVRGLANVNGVLVTVLSAPTLLAPESPVPEGLLVVLTLHRGQVGFAVEEADSLAPGGESFRVVDVEAVVRGLLGTS